MPHAAWCAVGAWKWAGHPVDPHGALHAFAASAPVACTRRLHAAGPAVPGPQPHPHLRYQGVHAGQGLLGSAESTCAAGATRGRVAQVAASAPAQVAGRRQHDPCRTAIHSRLACQRRLCRGCTALLCPPAPRRLGQRNTSHACPTACLPVLTRSLPSTTVWLLLRRLHLLARMTGGGAGHDSPPPSPCWCSRCGAFVCACGCDCAALFWFLV